MAVARRVEREAKRAFVSTIDHPASGVLVIGRFRWLYQRMPNFPLPLLPVAAALLLCASCGSANTTSVCGNERPCIPEGDWFVTYFMPSSTQSFSPNTIRVNADGSAEVVDEQVPDNSCPPTQTGPGNLTTSAALSDEGCTLTAFISKSWCQSGEANCEDRRVRLNFCGNSGTTEAGGLLDACVCWIQGSPSCSADDFVTVIASATRTDL